MSIWSPAAAPSRRSRSARCLRRATFRATSSSRSPRRARARRPNAKRCSTESLAVRPRAPVALSETRRPHAAHPTCFTDAMALTPVGDGVYDGVLNEHWTIGPRAAAEGARRRDAGAVCECGAGRAMRRHAGSEVWPIATSGNFLWAPDPGPMRVVTTVRKRGRRVSLVDVELTQGDRTAVRAAITLGDPEHHVAAAAVGQPGGAADDAGAAARAGTDRAGPPDGRHRASGARLRHPAVADHDGAARRRWAARDRVLGPAEGSARPMRCSRCCAATCRRR